MKEVEEELVDLVVEKNTMIGDSEDMDGANEGQFKPFERIPGGLSTEINGYLQIMQQASANISRWTGINDELAGLNNNPDLLNGARKLNITYGMNAINYAYVARETQYRAVFEVIAWYVKNAIDNGGTASKTIENLLGCEKTETLRNIGTIKDHLFYLRITLGMREQEMQSLQQSIAIMEQKGQLNMMQMFIIDQKKNLKDARLLLAAIEAKAEKKAAEQQQAQMANMQAIQKEKTDGGVALVQAGTEGKKEVTTLQGDIAAKLMQLAHQLGLSSDQTRDTGKRIMQQDRLNAAFLKQDRGIQAQSEKEQQIAVKPLM